MEVIRTLSLTFAQDGKRSFKAKRIEHSAKRRYGLCFVVICLVPACPAYGVHNPELDETSGQIYFTGSKFFPTGYLINFLGL